MAVDGGENDETSAPPADGPREEETPPAVLSSKSFDSTTLKNNESLPPRSKYHRRRRYSFDVSNSSRSGSLESSTSDMESIHSTGRPFSQNAGTSNVALGSDVDRVSSSQNQTATGGSFDDSGHSTSSVRELRRSILSQNPRVPPAFRNVDRSPSPKGRLSYSSDNESSPQKARRSRRPPTGRQSAFQPSGADQAFVEGAQPPKPPSRNHSTDEKRRPRSASSEQESSSTSSGLPVNLISLDSLVGDESKVSTYNAMLESIVDSGDPAVQKGLDILATMEQNGVTPDETTWKLIDGCSRLRDDDESETSIQKTEPILKFSLYSSEKRVGVDPSSIEHGKRQRKSWWMEQDLSLLPPAFRTSILAMLRRKGYGGGALEEKETATPAKKSPPLRTVRVPPDADAMPDVVQSVSDRKKVFLSSIEHLKSGDEGIVLPPSEPILKSSISDSGPKGSEFTRVFAEHGVVKYMRPDGLGKAARRKKKSNDPEAQTDDSASFLKALQEIEDSAGIKAFTALLSSIADSGLPDRANLAGKVLKRMKSIPIKVDDKALDLLVACTRIPEVPREPKPHELDMVDEVVLPLAGTEENAYKSPAPVVRKRVRFADTNSFRYIRRRRSIGSNERWDDPLTPPKRVTTPVDLAAARFSSGFRDDRPALPHRSISMGSWHSMSSQSERSSSSSSSATIDSLFDEESPDRFKLPFADDSPEVKGKKVPARTPIPRGDAEESRNAASSIQITPSNTMGKRSRLGLPTAPVRSSSNENNIFLSPPTSRPTLTSADNPRSNSASIPPPPINDPAMYRTPSPRPNRLRRRRSISGIERRADVPLTPPRRVSAPLELFIAQEALIAKKRLENARAAEAKAKSKDEESKIVKAMESISVRAGPASTSPGDRPMAVKVSRDKIPLSKLDSQKPPLPTPTGKSNRRRSIGGISADVNPVRPSSPHTGRPSSPHTTSKPTKTFQNTSEKRVSHQEIKPQSDDTGSKELLSPVGRHKEKVSELWKTVEFDKLDHDDSSISQSSTVRRSAQRPPKARSADRSITRPKMKHVEAPSWQRVLQGGSQGTTGKKGRSSRSLKNTSGDSSVNASLQDEKDQSKDTIDATATSEKDLNKRRAARRNSLPG